MLFYLGTHRPYWLRQLDIPLFVSHRTLHGYRRLPRALAPWALDSGAFTEINKHGGWIQDEKSYAAAVRRYRDEVGMLEWAAPQDWMCEPEVIAKTGLSVVEHQGRTVFNYLRLREIDDSLPIIPVLQGHTLSEYEACARLYYRVGVDLSREPVVGIGSVCRRQSTNEIEQVVSEVASWGFRLHGFGVKIGGLSKYAKHLSSADSMSWSLDGRWSKTSKASGKRTCGNCVLYALHYRQRALRSTRSG